MAGAAVGAPRFGVAEDAPKYAEDGGERFFGLLDELGMTVDRVTVEFDPSDPATIQERPALDRLVPTAAATGVDLVFQVYPTSPRAFAGDLAAATDSFASYLRLLATTYPDVRRYILLNEPNEAYFQVPQIVRGRIASATTAFTALAKGYDALKSVDPKIEVIGLALSPEANDRTSTSPVRFLDALGRRYRRSGRTKPLMDELALHLYPKNAARHDQNTHYGWPNTGPNDLDRIKQAFNDSFRGTGQPVFRATNRPAGRAVGLMLDEIGWQVRVRPDLSDLYTRSENTPVTTEQRQKAIYVGLISKLRCDPAIADFLFFHLIDEVDRRRFQSGLLRADGSLRPSFPAVASAIHAKPDCSGRSLWKPLTGVDSPDLSAPKKVSAAAKGVTIRPTAEEQVKVRLALVRIDSRHPPGREALARALAANGAEHGVLIVRSATVRAGRHPPIRLRARPPARLVLRGREVHRGTRPETRDHARPDACRRRMNHSRCIDRQV